ncbi:hypothetical protein FF011L_29250 [Roseimaritima multifibrata]|uniref:Uncharacterized protein n=1 Tax=Roseimaritima multifibrata TaxID=1930274 RepID=A0A517MH91_9BACT|nr:hypothetical protein FF011L_29250 [Roseimaritima multifibrata]
MPPWWIPPCPNHTPLYSQGCHNSNNVGRFEQDTKRLVKRFGDPQLHVTQDRGSEGNTNPGEAEIIGLCFSSPVAHSNQAASHYRKE